MKIVKQVVVMLDFGPMRRVFAAIYDLGLRIVLARMARHPAVHSIYGWGSYFQGNHLAGHSDIDMGVVINEGYPRGEGAHHVVARCYDRWRRVFPFLGGWDEKEGSLIFLDEAMAGYPVLASFRLKMKQGRLKRLYGDPFPIDIGTGPPTESEIVSEINTLLRVAILKGEEHSRKLLFWKRMFTKALAFASDLGLSALVDQAHADTQLAFLNESDRQLYWRSAEASKFFSYFLDLTKRIYQAVKDGNECIKVQYKPYPAGADVAASTPAQADPLLIEARVNVRQVCTSPSGPIGIIPHLYYFPIDEEMPLVDLNGSVYDSLRKLLRTMGDHDDNEDGGKQAYLVRAEDMLFIVADEQSYVDVIPLDPLTCANVYARIEGELEFHTPRAIHEQQRYTAEQTFAGLCADYRKHDGWITKYSYPCVFREDDMDTLRDTFEFFRSYVAHADDGVYIGQTDHLVDYLKQRHPESDEFLTDLFAYYRYLQNGRSGAQPPNNLFRVLHQFTTQLLGGASTISIDPHQKSLSITVGIITRNRANDLKRVLESLTTQTRMPDEIVLADNGSTDDTKAVVESFDGRLAIKYVYLPDASIPLARNMVIEHATQEIVAFTDDDCDIRPEWLGSVERGFLRAENIGIVGGWVEHWPAEQETTVDNYFSLFHSHKS